MRISNAKIYYQINGTWIEIESENLISLDVTKVQATSRPNKDRIGAFYNVTYDSVTIKIVRGHYDVLDACHANDGIYLKIDDGISITIGRFIVSEKTTANGISNIKYDIDESVAVEQRSKATGVQSGVQDVQVDGETVVSEEGIAEINLVPYAKTEYVEEIAEEAKTEIVKLYNEVGKKQDKLTAGENIKIENNVISAKAGGASTTTELKVTEPARESLGGESTIQSAVNIENVNAIKELTQIINEEAARATSEEDRLDGLIDALDATKADQEAVTAGLAKKQNKLTSENAGTNITITEEGGIVKINSIGGSGGVDKDYVDTQDQSVLKTCRNELADKQNKLTAGTGITIENDVISATGGGAVWGSITGKITDQTDLEDRFGAFATMLEEKITHETTERQEADQQFASAIEELGNTKENTLVAGTNIEIDRDTQPGKTIIKAINGGSGVSQEYVDQHDASTLASAKTYTDEKVLVVSQALDTVAANLATETTERRNTDNEIKEDLNTKANDNAVVHVMTVPSSTTLTTEERTKIAGGIYINGTFLSLDNPVFFPATDDGNRLYGLVIGKTGDTTAFGEYTINTSNVISMHIPSGDTKRYFMTINNNREVDLTNIKTPTKDTDATNKTYVDTAITNALGDVETVLETLTTGSGAN